MLFGLLLYAISIHVNMLKINNSLTYKIQKLEAGPAKGLFVRPEEKTKPLLTDEELNELIKQMLKQMIRERSV